MKDEHDSMVSDYDGIKADYDLLSSDLKETDSQLKETDSQLKGLSANIRSDMNDLEESYSETTTNLENRYSETIDNLVSKFSDGSPRGYFSSVDDLSGKVAGVYINDADGYVYYWDGETISDAITRYEYTADTDALNNHIANKNEPHVQRVSLGGTSFEDIINGTYTGFDGDNYITNGDVKRFYLTNIGWGYDCVELIASGSEIDGGCIQILNVYKAYDVICKQYYRIKTNNPWSAWKLVEGVETIDGGYADTWRTAEAFNSAYELENVKRYKVLIEDYIVGDLFTMAYTDAVTNFVIVDQWFTFMHTTFYRQGSSHKNTLPKLGWKEWKQLNVIDNELSETSENAIQNKVVTAEINSVKNELATIVGGTTTVKCHVGDNIPTGDNVKCVKVFAPIAITDEFIWDENYTSSFRVGDVINQTLMGREIIEIFGYTDDAAYQQMSCSSYDVNWYVVFEVTTNGELNNNTVVGTYTGNDIAERFIELGFTPSAVEVCLPDGNINLTNNLDGVTFTLTYGGTALYDAGNSMGYDCLVEDTYPVIKIVENGFKVYLTAISDTRGVLSNSMGVRYYFKAYKSNQFIVID